MTTPRARWAQLAVLTIFLTMAFGADAALAGVDVTIDIRGAGSVKIASGNQDCTSTNPNENVVGQTCVAHVIFPAVFLDAVPAGRPADNWKFTGWSGDCAAPDPGSSKTACVVFGDPFFGGFAKRKVTVGFDDYRAPTVGIDEGPAGTVQDESVSFAFTADEPGVTFRCRLVNETDFESCGPGRKSYSVLNRGQHTFEVEPTDASGKTGIVQQRTWTVDFDRDRDRYDHDGLGARQPLDCDDANASIFPGARDVPKNGIDEDCDGVDAEYPSITSEVRYDIDRNRRFAIFRRLSVIRPPDGAKVEVRCRGRGCRFAKRSQVAAPGTSEMAFAADLRNVRLRRGAVLEVWITRSAMRGKVVRLSVRRRARVSRVTLCVLPDSRTPGGCGAG